MGCCAVCETCCRWIGCSCSPGTSGNIASISRKRACTDVPCLIAFVIFVIFLVSYIWGPAFAEGDPDRLIRGVDFAGRICGIDDGVKDKPYAFWPDPTEFRFKVCTDDCNEATFTKYSQNHIQNTIGGHSVGYPTQPYLDKYCLPLGNSTVSIAGFDSYSNKFQRVMGDVETAMPIIAASIGIALFFSFFYVWLMKMCVGCLVWGTVAVILIGGIFLGYLFFAEAQEVSDDPEKQKNEDMYRVCAYIAWAVTGIFFLIIVFARNRIRIAIQVIKSAGRAISDMPFMVIFPIWPLILVVGFFFAWVYGAIYIFSAGESTENDTPDELKNVKFAADSTNMRTGKTYDVMDYDQTIQNAFAPHFFLLLWVVQIAVYFTFSVIAGSVSDWYFTKRDENGKKLRGSGEGELSNRAVLQSCGRTSRYHLGTIIYAALIIAIIQFIRCTVRYFERTMNGKGGSAKVKKVILKIINCCLWCLECCLDKVNRNALIWVSIYGDAFCPSVCSSFKLIWANLVRVAVITFFSAIVTLLGKVLIPLMTVVLCAAILIFADPFKSEMESPALPIAIILVMSLAVALLFLTVYDTAIDTVFMCFLIDEKHNKESGTMLADEGLKNIVQKYEAESKKLANEMQRGTKMENNEEVVKVEPVENVEI